MNELERYIREQYSQDRQEFEEVRQLAIGALPTIIDLWNNDRKAWPYVAGQEVQNYSYSTTSMILFMLSVVLERTKNSSLMPKQPDNAGFTSMMLNLLAHDRGNRDGKEAVEVLFWQGLEKLLEEVAKEKENHSEKQTLEMVGLSRTLTKSKTYGENDVLTLTWLTELLQVVKRSDPSGPATATTRRWLNSLEEPLRNSVKELRKATMEGLQLGSGNGQVRENDESSGSQRSLLRCLFYREYKTKLAAGRTSPPGNVNEDKLLEPLEHPFPLVRLVLLLEAHALFQAEATQNGPQERLTEEQLGGKALREYFEHGLHEQIAYHSIPDSRFDPAFLVFCLEGALRFPTSSVSMEGVERALSLLEECQDETPYWRSLTPILTTPQGNVLFPLSVEVANSLLRVTDILDRRHDQPRSFLRCRLLLQRYVRWLKAQRVSRAHESEGEKGLHFGWHSENVAYPDQIHLWATSEVIIFLLNYQLRFHDGIAHTMLKDSGLQVNRDLTRKRPPHMSPSSFWTRSQKGWLHNEPLKDHPTERYRIYEVILKKYLKPRDSEQQGGEEPAYSILLYGPPGTGKTTVCEEIAIALGWPLVNVTPSDFLAGGPAEVEARAKAIFAMLQEQRDKVVLLDEIDHFLLDRDSPEYDRQEGIFQFMTPGMLTKINDLRRTKSLVFIIATNYAERIDPAIKRPGRIDNQLLLLPPNLAQRKRILDGLWSEHGEKPSTGSFSKLDKSEKDQKLSTLARKTPLFTYIELKHLARQVFAEKNDNEFRSVFDNPYHAIKPVISLHSYIQRFCYRRNNSENAPTPKPPEKAPTAEYLMLLYIWLEAFFKSDGLESSPEISDRREVEGIYTVREALNLTGDADPERRRILMDYVQDPHVVDSLCEWLPKWDNANPRQNKELREAKGHE